MYSGQKPKDPLVVPVSRENGTPVDLTLYDDVDFVFRDADGDLIVIDGTTSVQNTNEAVYTWGTATIFPAPGEYSVTVKMTKSGGVVDYASVGIIRVERSLEDAIPFAALVSAEDVDLLTGAKVGITDILLAQAVIEAELRMDLSVAPFEAGSTFFTDVSAKDLFLLRSAICWETKYLKEHPEVLSALPNVESASDNGSSIKYAQNGSDGLLDVLAAKCLKGLSWKKKTVKTLMPTPARYHYLRGQDLINDVGYEQWRPV
jgi:hypothetical protein